MGTSPKMCVSVPVQTDKAKKNKNNYKEISTYTATYNICGAYTYIPHLNHGISLYSNSIISYYF